MANIKDSLVRCGAILYGDFTLASGKKSKYYIDIKKAITDPKILEEVADEMAHIIDGRTSRSTGSPASCSARSRWRSLFPSAPESLSS